MKNILEYFVHIHLAEAELQPLCVVPNDYVIAIATNPKNVYLSSQLFLQPTNRLIRLTSPKLNYIIGAGAVLLYLEICVMVIPSIDPIAVTILCSVSLCTYPCVESKILCSHWLLACLLHQHIQVTCQSHLS